MEEILQRTLKQLSSGIRQSKFIFTLLTTLMTYVGKANYRNMSRYSLLCEKTFSRWYRKSFDFQKLNYTLAKETYTNINHRRIAVHDASYMKKSGKKTDCMGYFYSGCAGKALKGLEISGLAVVDLHVNTAFMMDAKLTTVSDEANRTAFYANHIMENSAYLIEQCIDTIVLDGFYAKKNFFKAMQGSGLAIISKLRRDCRLKYAYEGLHGKVGRPKKYDGNVDFDDLSRFEQIDYDEDTLVYSKVLYSTISKNKVRVVILQKNEKGRIGQMVLISTRTSMSPLEVIENYKARFQIEFCFRDAKQHTGLEDCQSTQKDAIEFHINASFTALNLLKLEDRLACEHDNPTVISIASYKRRKYNEYFFHSIIEELKIPKTCKKFKTAFDKLCSLGVIAA